jgi:carbamoyl-phosphate synthase large subunit
MYRQAALVDADDLVALLGCGDSHGDGVVALAQRLRALGLGIAATAGTAAHLAAFELPVDQIVAKVQEVSEGDAGRETAVDLIADGKISFVINTPRGRLGRSDGELIRKAASLHRVSTVTTVDAALAAVQGLTERHLDGDLLTVKTLQEYHAGPGPRDESGRDLSAPELIAVRES